MSESNSGTRRLGIHEEIKVRVYRSGDGYSAKLDLKARTSGKSEYRWECRGLAPFVNQFKLLVPLSVQKLELCSPIAVTPALLSCRWSSVLDPIIVPNITGRLIPAGKETQPCRNLRPSTVISLWVT